MPILASLDTLGTVADRQTDVPPELQQQLAQHGRDQFVITFSESYNLDNDYVSTKLAYLMLVTRDEAELFVSAGDVDRGLAAVIASREDQP
jgi:hypothetical protein